mmetsp:Transcript_522/g.1894  ORF Transcript_522/g.1894 Transcript_522/m.1894 type:complete len:317 (+) Transcript_522:44-994(+)
MYQEFIKLVRLKSEIRRWCWLPVYSATASSRAHSTGRILSTGSALSCPMVWSATTKSPRAQKPCWTALVMDSVSAISVALDCEKARPETEARREAVPFISSGVLSVMYGVRPELRRHWLATVSEGVRPSKPMAARSPEDLGTTATTTGMLGRYLERMRAVRPLAARTMMHLAPTLAAVRTADEVRDSMTLIGCGVESTISRKTASLLMHVSASRQMLAMIWHAWIGNLPPAVSPESITQSVPSRTAFATSVASARVGRGLDTIDSSICVAVMTGLAAMRHAWIIFFCAMNIVSSGISIPRSPRATMTPSDASTIWS